MTVRRYEQRIEQFRQNRIFEFDQKKKDVKFNGGEVKPNDVQMVQKLKGFGVISGALGKGTNEKQDD